MTSSITARNNTPAGKARAAGLPEPTRIFTQDAWRERRHKRLITAHLSGGFSPSREVADVAADLERRIVVLCARYGRSRLDGPSISMRLRLPVAAFADAVHEFVSTVIGWQAEADGYAKTQRLASEPGKRRYALNLIKDTAQRPELPEISAVSIRRGTWAVALVQMATAADGLRVVSGYSDRLQRLLIETVDRAAGDLGRKVAALEQQPVPAAAQATDPRSELERMGISL